jgi:cytochrome c oxidase assembly protein subunit 15
MRRLAAGIGCLLLLQITLGLVNIIAQLPLLNALAHNLVAANLLMLTIVFVRQIYLRQPVSEKNPVIKNARENRLMTD